MKNIFCIFTISIVCMFLFTACVESYFSDVPAGNYTDGESLSAEFTVESSQNEDRPILREWEGFELMREYFDGSHWGITIPNNVITTECELLVVYYRNSSGSDEMLFGVYEAVQVHLDGEWYTLTGFLPARDEPLVLPVSTGWQEEDDARHEIFLPQPLPPGRYRVVDNFFNERMLMGNNIFAYFWVIEPDAERPPESLTDGDARLEDINLTVSAFSAVRPQITDADETFFFHIENITGKEYLTTSVRLEKYDNGDWIDISFQHANFGLQFGWTNWANQLWLHEPLETGDYRITLTMNVFNRAGDIFPQHTFSVIPVSDAPEPAWDVTQLRPSQISEISTNVTMSISNNVLTQENHDLEIVLEVDREYMYGMPFTIEVNLGGRWYVVPFTGGFHDIGLMIDENTSLEQRTIQRSFVHGVGVVPPGQYRIIKEFNAWEGYSLPTNTAREIAAAEFIVAEVLHSS